MQEPVTFPGRFRAIPALPLLLLATAAGAQAVTERNIHVYDTNVVACFYCSAPPIEGRTGAMIGTTPYGGANNWGTLYRYSARNGYEVLHDFGGPGSWEPESAPAQLPNGDIFGVTGNPKAQGKPSPGALWRYTAAGKYEVVDRFTGPNGTGPNALMSTPDGHLYGVTSAGGAFDRGVLFTVDAAFHVQPVYSFSAAGGATVPEFAPVLGSDGAFYGIAGSGAAKGYGGVWRYGPDGTFTVLHSFGTTSGDGTDPSGGLMQGRDGALYGVTRSTRDLTGMGTLYRVTTDGVYTLLHTFDGTDGTNPIGALAEDAVGNILGATELSLASGGPGTIFKWSPDGTLSTAYVFDIPHDGQFPNGVSLASTGKAWGLTADGGASGFGTLWQLMGL